MKHINYFLSLLSLLSLATLFSCSDDDPPSAENEEEIIDLVKLTFTPAGTGTPIVVEAKDDDGEGPGDFELDPINLAAGVIYTLTIEVRNEEEGEDITEEIKGEATAHQFFFAWTGQIFENPNGLGNYADDGQSQGPYGNEGGSVLYADEETDLQFEPDEDGVVPRDNVPVGLTTTWETIETPPMDAQQFRVVLLHQPGLKTATSDSSIGDPDVDLTFSITIQ
ncbi:hypothetical protein FNH22_04945 [Fulvivirga sp. M361]|uniref:hypothetical protein n=1 Tax=Fulvivirga sp. M361 TaxID=2594266 RepID=UPI00117A37D5|nr:hypothetical protein [Fulvivirga sp. M361]TRX61405.1 hypothetical protein FNH22_04945 [Fulvivirga sp. M361]